MILIFDYSAILVKVLFSYMDLLGDEADTAVMLLLLVELADTDGDNDDNAEKVDEINKQTFLFV